MKVRLASSLAIALIAAPCVAGRSWALDFTVTKSSIGGEGGHDYIVAEPGSGRVFVSRETHVMVVDGPTARVLGDIPDSLQFRTDSGRIVVAGGSRALHDAESQPWRVAP